MLKHIIFDFDGTIADSLRLTITIGNQLAPRYGFSEFTEEFIKELRYLPAEEKIKKLGIKLYKLPKLVFEFNKVYHEYIGSLETAKGVDTLLRDLKDEGFGLGVISSNAEENIEKFLKKNNLSLFDGIYSSKGLFGKPAAINKYMVKHGVRRDEVIYVGDELRDIKACRKAGIRIIAVTWGFDPPELLTKGNPDYILNSSEEVFKLIKSIR
jgi:phosphoglycolate phosphatase